MDRHNIRLIRTQSFGDEEEYFQNLGVALAYNPAVAWYCKKKAPEIAGHVEKLIATAPNGCTKEWIRQAECYVLDQYDWAVVYVYPEIMNQNCPYINNWDKRKHARFTPASLWRLRDFMRKKIEQEEIRNVAVLDGMCDCPPYEDSTIDIVMSGHVLGDDYDKELAELERVTKSGGWILDCPGENDRKFILALTDY